MFPKIRSAVLTKKRIDLSREILEGLGLAFPGSTGHQLSAEETQPRGVLRLMSDAGTPPAGPSLSVTQTPMFLPAVMQASGRADL